MSTHIAKVVKIEEMIAHPNADNLAIIHIDGWQCCVKKTDFKVGDLVIHIQPDFVVDTTRPEFAWLHKEGKTKHRVRVCKLRGAVSHGFLVPAPESAIIGENWLERLSLERYEPVIHGHDTKCLAIKGPDGIYPHYDVDNYYSYHNVMNDGELVTITEKLHGSSGRFVFTEGKMWCGSRKEWKEDIEHSLWWKCLRNNPWIEEWCRANEGLTLYGELLGVQGGFPYGTTDRNVGFRTFDVLKQGQWLEFNDAFRSVTDAGLHPERFVPVLYLGPWNREVAIRLSEGQTTVSNANHIREGVVIQPIPDRLHYKLGRIKLKLVSDTYLEKV